MSGTALAPIRDILAHEPPNRLLVEYRKTPASLMVNVVYKEVQANTGRTTMPYSCSGIIVLKADQLPPDVDWKDKPEGSTRAGRESCIDLDKPLISSRNLYAYKDGRLRV